MGPRTKSARDRQASKGRCSFEHTYTSSKQDGVLVDRPGLFPLHTNQTQSPAERIDLLAAQADVPGGRAQDVLVDLSPGVFHGVMGDALQV